MDLPSLIDPFRALGAPLKADPSAQLRLLDVQELDSSLDALRHRLATIPEVSALAELAKRRGEVDDRVRDLRVSVSDLTEEQRRADADVEQVKVRRERDQGMVDGGAVTDPKALERLLGELESLARRIRDLEDLEIEVMERLETAQNELDAGEAELARMDEEAATLEAARASRAADLQKEMVEVGTERLAAAEGLPEDLMALYERLREQKGGVGAAALRRRECGGCRLALNASDLASIAAAAADEVVRCEECNRILVRTAESGL